MPVDEIVGGLLGAILEIVVGLLGGMLRFFGWVFGEIIVQLLIRGLGSLLCKPFKKNEVNSSIEILVGILAWLLIIFVCFKLSV